MGDLERLGSKHRVPLNPDESGFIGRECPNLSCQKYFKIRPGTGLTGENLPCYCPYCGHVDSPQTFFTQEQIEYAKSVVVNKFTNALLKDMKAMEFKTNLGLGLTMEMSVEGKAHPIKHYREKELETYVTCEKCTLQYCIYGVFAFCPDCGMHNSFQILLTNLEVAQKQISLAEKVEPILKDRLLADALKDSVSSFDGFGREVYRINSAKQTTISGGERKISFQNLLVAQKKLLNNFGFDFLSTLTSGELDLLIRCFQKRHLFSHKMGVVDQAYLDSTSDPHAVLGRKISLEKEEVLSLIEELKKVGESLINDFSKI
jgi:hypothetical protein